MATAGDPLYLQIWQPSYTNSTSNVTWWADATVMPPQMPNGGAPAARVLEPVDWLRAQVSEICELAQVA